MSEAIDFIVKLTEPLYTIPSIYMGELTTLALNTPNKASLRTTIPMFIVKQWGLKRGDKLDWSLEARKNEITIVIRKVESNKKK